MSDEQPAAAIRQAATMGVDIGHGHRILGLDDGNILWHDGVCVSWRLVDLTSGDRHRVVAGDVHHPETLTIAGSLPCDQCGAHGFVRDGRWHTHG